MIIPENLRFLYFGPATYGGTCLQRFNYLKKYFKESYFVDSRRVFPDKNSGRSLFTSIQGRIGLGPIFKLSKQILLQEIDRFKPDILWIDNGFIVHSETLKFIQRNLKCKIIHYTPDSISAPGMSSICMRKAIPFYDYTITTKEQDLELYKKFNSKNIILSFQGYDPKIHNKIKLSNNDKNKFGCDVSFIGQHMKDRAADLSYLKSVLKIDLKIYGFGWEKRFANPNLRDSLKGPAIGKNYAKAIKASKISIGFLNRLVGDTFTTRTFEIPACGGFLLAEYSNMHKKIFIEGKEAIFFSNKEELVEKVDYYLSNETERKKIASKGYSKINSSKYTWPLLMKNLVEQVL
jgi:spore maturation protein CgeB